MTAWTHAHTTDGFYHNSPEGHGTMAICACQETENPPKDMPPKCQAILLIEDWAPSFFAGGTTGEEASQARFKVRCLWASGMGIHGVRVDTPPCVKKVILNRFGLGSSTFFAGKNKCPCVTCQTYRARTNEPGSRTVLMLPAPRKAVKLKHTSATAAVTPAAAPPVAGAAAASAFSGAATATPAAGAAAAPAASKRKREGTNEVA